MTRTAGDPAASLTLRGYVSLPPHVPGHGGFDHGDVHADSGRVFVAHTSNGTVEVIDGERLTLLQTIPGCPEGSGVLCSRGDDAAVFAAARGVGKVLVLDPLSGAVRNEVAVGPKPNGLAWDTGRRRLLVADVADFLVRLLDPLLGTTLATTRLPGRPRWCVFDAPRDRFLVNIREPACVVALDARDGQLTTRIDVSAAGPHGLDVDPERNRAFVACDAGALVVLDLTRDCELAHVRMSGEPDAIWFNPRRELLYVAIGNPGVVDVISCRELKVTAQVRTEPGAHTTAFDVARQQLYVFLPNTCRAAVYA